MPAGLAPGTQGAAIDFWLRMLTDRSRRSRCPDRGALAGRRAVRPPTAARRARRRGPAAAAAGRSGRAADGSDGLARPHPDGAASTGPTPAREGGQLSVTESCDRHPRTFPPAR